MVKVSVIVPVYNGEKYLHQCVDSICRQTLRDIEIIFIDDGSTDSSCTILEQFQKKDDRIQIYHQENQYCCIARNNGLEHAGGEYVIFWDCDDYFEPCALQHMYNQAKKMDADICVSNVWYYDEKINARVRRKGTLKKEAIPPENLFNIKNNEDNILSFANTELWNKLMKRSFIQSIGLRFQTSHRYAEDAWFVWIALCSAERITTIDETLVTYRELNANGQVNSLDKKEPQVPFAAMRDTAIYLKEHNIFPERSYVNKILGNILFTLRHYHTIGQQRRAIEYIQNECMEIMEIKPRSRDFYYSEDAALVADHLLNDSAEEFQGFLMFYTYSQLRLTGIRLNLKSARFEEVTSSGFYRVAYFLSRAVSKIKKLFHHK